MTFNPHDIANLQPITAREREAIQHVDFSNSDDKDFTLMRLHGGAEFVVNLDCPEVEKGWAEALGLRGANDTADSYVVRMG